MSVHPTTTDGEIDFILDALSQIRRNGSTWGADYSYDSQANEFRHKDDHGNFQRPMEEWFSLQ